MAAELSEQERAILYEGEQVKMLTMHGGYVRLREVMRQWENEALLDLDECRSSDDRLRANLSIRWQERKSFNRMIESWIRGVVEKRKEVLREIALEHGNTATDAFDMAENL